MPVVKKPKTFAELCVKDHKTVIAKAIRKIVNENNWTCAMLGVHGKTSTPTASFIIRGDEHKVSLDKICLIAYELGIAIGMTLVNPNA